MTFKIFTSKNWVISSTHCSWEIKSNWPNCRSSTTLMYFKCSHEPLRRQNWLFSRLLWMWLYYVYVKLYISSKNKMLSYWFIAIIGSFVTHFVGKKHRFCLSFQSDFRYLLNRHFWNRSEAHRQAVALRRSPAYHGPHYHHHRRRRTVIYGSAYYSRDSSQCSPPRCLPIRGPPRPPSGYSCNNSGSCNLCLYGSLNNQPPQMNGQTHAANGVQTATVRSNPCVNHGAARGSRRNFQLALEYSSYSEVWLNLINFSDQRMVFFFIAIILCLWRCLMKKSIEFSG